MRRLLLLLIVLLTSGLAQAVPTISSGMCNDNILNLPDLPLDSKYGGPDDRYTFSFFVHYTEEDWKLLTNFYAITLREENYRYDYLYTLFVYRWRQNNLGYSLGIGMDFTGNLGFESVQNSVHRAFHFYELELPYLEFSPGIVAEGEVDYRFISLWDDRIRFNIMASLMLTTSRVPDCLTVAIPVEFEAGPVYFEIEGGHDYRFRSTDEFITGNSLFYKLALSINFFDAVILTCGFSREFIYERPEDGILTEYEKHTDTFRTVDVLNAPQFYFALSMGARPPRLEDLPLP